VVLVHFHGVDRAGFQVPFGNCLEVCLKQAAEGNSIWENDRASHSAVRDQAQYGVSVAKITIRPRSMRPKFSSSRANRLAASMASEVLSARLNRWLPERQQIE